MSTAYWENPAKIEMYLLPSLEKLRKQNVPSCPIRNSTTGLQVTNPIWTWGGGGKMVEGF